MDGQPRTLTVQDMNMLCNFAELVVREVEKKCVVGLCPFGLYVATDGLKAAFEIVAITAAAFT